jgi:integrase
VTANPRTARRKQFLEANAMPKRHSTTATTTDATTAKPAKPEGSPIYPHNSGKWAKKIRGKLYYFGRWDDHEAAVNEYEAVREALENGRDRATIDPNSFTVADACNHYLHACKGRVERDDLASRTFVDYERTAEGLVKMLGRDTAVLRLEPQHFREVINKIASKRNAIGTANEVTRVKTLFNWCVAEGLLDQLPKYGPDFRQPKAKSIRAHRARQPAKAFNPDELLATLDECGVHIKAMTLLGCNCGFSNSDCSTMPIESVNFKTGWLDFARAKTAIPRHIPLWKATLEALMNSLARRPEPTIDATKDAFFVRPDGREWAGSTEPTNHISKRFNGAMKRAEVLRKGLSFYGLRHTFETVAGGTKDQIAVDAIMGHVDNSMAAIYRSSIEEQRLLDVVSHVHGWLYGNENQ